MIQIELTLLFVSKMLQFNDGQLTLFSEKMTYFAVLMLVF
ncbi:hypothetical protein VK055_1589 [Klebsiella pneumoniae subsp. pneumoniae]|nr:hypothetical protein VK055_1589 [Klebsiella pneumoniae subsp. pneumoniae]